MEISIKLQGTSPLIMCRFSDAAALKATSGAASASAAQERPSPEEQARDFVYFGVNGNVIIPQPMMFRCIVDGGSFHKSGKSKITTLKTSILYSCLEIHASELPLISGPWSIDTRAVRIPATGGRILCHRPIFHEWATEFQLELDESILSPGLLRKIIDDSGRRVGIGSFRPGCKGPFGKFRVDQWDVLEAGLAVAAE